MTDNVTALKTREPVNALAMAPANMTEAMNMAGMLANSALVPPSYKGKKEDTLVAMMMGYEIGLNPIQSLQNIAVINGKPSIYGDAMLALVQNHPAFKSIDESFDEKSMTAICTVVRKGGKPHTVKFSREDAVAANLWGKQGPWTNYPKRMLQMRARGFALRNQFADALLGLISAEEAQDMPQGDYEEPPAPETVVATLDPYPDEKFIENLPKWKELITSKGKNPDEIISMIESRYTLTEGQANTILSLEQREADNENA